MRYKVVAQRTYKNTNHRGNPSYVVDQVPTFWIEASSKSEATWIATRVIGKVNDTFTRSSFDVFVDED